MKYFLDTEFEPTPPAQLISIALVREDGEPFYAENVSIDLADETKFPTLFVRDHVLPRLIINEFRTTTRFTNQYFRDQTKYDICKSIDEIRRTLVKFVGDDKDPKFYAWYGAQDWVLLVGLFDGQFSNMPPNWPHYYHELKMLVELAGISKEETLKYVPKPKDQHFALADARWNKELYEWMMH